MPSVVSNANSLMLCLRFHETHGRSRCLEVAMQLHAQALEL
jgi:hypothetical protein